MKILSTEIKSLLDKLYNLRGEDSVILTKMNKEREEAIATGERTKNEKAILLDKIKTLSLEEETLQQEGEKLSTLLSGINRAEFATVLDRLNIDFDPASINEKLNKTLPGTIKKVVEENEAANKELEDVENEMNNAITKVEELGIRKDEALSNQAKLNEFFELALDGNINITRDEITSLLEKFNFNEDEQREAAKILMFPEDALYEYDASKKSSDKSGKTITEVLVEAKKESVHEPEPVEPVLEHVPETSQLEDIFDKVMEENKVLEPTKEEVTEVQEESAEPVIEKVETQELFKEEKESLFTEPSESIVSAKPEEVNEKTKLENLLNELGLVSSRFSNDDILKILASYDEDLIKKNVNCLKENNIDLDILYTHSSILTDQELDLKIAKLTTIGKSTKDISLSPKVLVKYDLKGLNNTINVLQISGLDPKKVPLMAY